jgi:hypothetical protein
MRNPLPTRILPVAIAEKFVAGPSGALQPLASGIIGPVAQTATHAGIAAAKPWAFNMP